MTDIGVSQPTYYREAPPNGESRSFAAPSHVPGRKNTIYAMGENSHKIDGSARKTCQECGRQCGLTIEAEHGKTTITKHDGGAFPEDCKIVEKFG